jgi:subtilisin family serine protease
VASKRGGKGSGLKPKRLVRSVANVAREVGGVVAKAISLKIGGSAVRLMRSDTQIAIRPALGMGRSMLNELRSIAARLPLERRGRLERFELVDIRAAKEELSRVRAFLRGVASIDQEVPVYHTSADAVPFVPVGTIYLGFKPGVTDATKQGLLDKHALELVAAEPNNFLTVRLTTPGTDAVELAAKLQEESSVAVAEPDLVTTKRTRNFTLPQEELLARQWHLENTGTHNGVSVGFEKGADARVVAAWNKLGSLGSSDVVVGIIDDGFDLNHLDLVDKAVHPWDFARNSSDVRPEPDLANLGEGDWHGTACAGVAVGKAQGGQIIGAAPNAKLIPVRMNPDLSPIQVAKWFDHMTDNGAWVVSCSWGAEAKVYPLPERIAAAIARCARDGRNGKGCVVVFAAGNSRQDINDPPNSQNGLATHPDVIAVSASTSRDAHADYSNFGKEISVCAPSGGFGGWSIITSDVGGTYTDPSGVQRDSGYAGGDYNLNFTGTSSACPLVAGVCALVLGVNPDLTAADVRDIIKSTARKIGGAQEYVDGHSVKFGHGCVDAERAVDAAIARNASGAQVAGVRVPEVA